MRTVPTTALLAMGLLAVLPAQAAKPLRVYFIDVEGGQSTLVVSPSGQSLLIDAGYGANAGRDALRIAKAAKDAGVKKIDYLVITHFHDDHYGGVANLLQKLPVLNVLDHGVSIETHAYPPDYEKAIAGIPHKTYAAGDKIPIKGLDVTVVAASGKNFRTTGDRNPFCQGVTPKPEAPPSENPQSGAFMIEFGKFRLADLGDNEYNRELSMVCPENTLGYVDVYLTSHHGAETPVAMYALAPRVVVMNNGPRKGGNADTMKRVKAFPGLQDFWQLHYAIAAGKEANTPDPLIANVDEDCEGVHLKLTAQEDGSFTVLNPRNKYTKTYAAR